VDRAWGRPFTRRAVRVHKKNFVKGIPGSKLNKFNMGNHAGDFNLTLSIVPKKRIQVRHNALESSRVAANAYIRKMLKTDSEYYLRIRVFPHQILREHAQAAVAQADRFFQGMKKPFGRPIGVAARVKEGQPIITVSSDKKNEDVLKEGLRRAGMKIPGGFRIIED